jgi:hypothetical protein
MNQSVWKYLVEGGIVGASRQIGLGVDCWEANREYKSVVALKWGQASHQWLENASQKKKKPLGRGS